jgi:DnaJ-class molecular chaperone
MNKSPEAEEKFKEIGAAYEVAFSNLISTCTGPDV